MNLQRSVVWAPPQLESSQGTDAPPQLEISPPWQHHIVGRGSQIHEMLRASEYQGMVCVEERVAVAEALELVVEVEELEMEEVKYGKSDQGEGGV